MISTWIMASIVVIVGYLLGAVPFAVLVSRMYGVDVLREGSGNPGATNVKRVVGRMAGNIVFVCDLLKGVVATGWPLWILKGEPHVFYLSLGGLAAAVLGHSFSVFLKFKGGKGVATTMGGILVIMPLGFGVGVLVWLVIFYVTGYVSVASIIFGISLPITAYFFNQTGEEIVLAVALMLLITIRHISNIKRLAAGTENCSKDGTHGS